MDTQFLSTLTKYDTFPPLTKIFRRGRISLYADVVELVDSLDLGSNARACRFESCCPHQKRRGRQSLPLLFWFVATGREPIYMQQSGGLLSPRAPPRCSLMKSSPVISIRHLFSILRTITSKYSDPDNVWMQKKAHKKAGND